VCPLSPASQYILFLYKCKMRFFPEIWCINVRGCLKFVYKVPDWTAKPDH